MSRNRYEPAYGACPLQWHRGDPPNAGDPVIVEVWRSDLLIGEYTVAARPRVRVHAQLKLRVWADAEGGSGWKVLGWRGRLATPAPGDVRRWADLPHRWWETTVTLDGWDGVR